MRLIILLILPLMLFAAKPVLWHHDYEKAYAAARSTHKPLMLFLTQPQCGTCRFMKEEVLNTPDVQNYLAEHFVTAELYIKDPSLPPRYRVEVSPVFTFIDPAEGEIIEQIMGGRKAPQFLHTLKSVIEDEGD